MGIFETMRVSLSGLTAQRLRMDVISSNIANVETTRSPEGGPYLRRQVIFQAESAPPFAMLLSNQLDGQRSAPNASRGVAVVGIRTDPEAVREGHGPAPPGAGRNGSLRDPDIDVVTEMADLLAATRAYEANVTVLDALKSMAMRALSIGRA